MEIITSTNILSTVILIALSIIGYFVKDKLKSLAASDDRLEGNYNRLEGKIDKISEQMGNIAGRVSRIEGSMRLSPLGTHSPVTLTPVGQEILEKSEIGAAADRLKDELMAKIRMENPKTAYDVQEVSKKIFQEFAWSEADLNKFKDFAFQSGKWTLADIYEVGAIHFRDLALKELGMPVDDLDKK
ncbi:MAG: hypothetical protein HY007_00795 [Candidatus Sungbacteria bacterium]|nr:hypothetical protein [Candidatus Sungbacteria bacterium]